MPDLKRREALASNPPHRNLRGYVDPASASNPPTHPFPDGGGFLP